MANLNDVFRNIVVGRGRNLTFYGVESSTSLFQFSDFGWCCVMSVIILEDLFLLLTIDVKITSLTYNLWSRDNNLTIGLENGQIMVYNALPNSQTLLVSLDSQEVCKLTTQTFDS